MKKRIAFIAPVAVFALTPVGYYCFFAFIRDEHFYHGLPSSHWGRAIKYWTSHKSSPPSYIPYLDSFLTYVGFRGKPAVLRTDEAAIPVLLDLVSAADDSSSYRAATALARIVWTGNSVAEMEVQPLPVEADGIRFVVLIVQPLLIGGEDRQTLLLDQRGHLLDTLSCYIGQGSSGSQETEVAHDSEDDGATLVIRSADSDHDLTTWITHGADPERSAFDVEFPEWKRKGLCRLAVQNGRFEVLWPPLREPP